VITNSEISGNRTTGNFSQGGGAASDFGLYVSNSIVSDNLTIGESSDGGGLSGLIIQINSSTIANNDTYGFGSRGGGTYSGGRDAAAISLFDALIIGNSTNGAYADGGGVCVSAEYATVYAVNSTFAENLTTGTGARGGGVASTSVTLRNSSVSGNGTTGFGAAGGGVFGVAVTLRSSTVSGNYTTGEQAAGGGVYAASRIYNPGAVSLGDSVFLGNSSARTSADEVGLFPGGSFNGYALDAASLRLTGGNILGDGAGGADLFSGATDVGDTTAAAVFAETVTLAGGVVAGRLADNGGPAPTIALKADVANPALDRSVGGTSADARGVAATDIPDVGADGSGAEVRDLGAFEVRNIPQTASADTAGVARGGVATIAVLANDSAAFGGLDASSVRLAEADSGSNGKVRTVVGVGAWTVDPATGSVTFASDPAFTGFAAVAYTVADTSGVVSNEAVIRISVGAGVTLVGGNGPDTLIGSVFADTISGLGGSDSIRGKGGNDTLIGAGGADTLVGNDGSDSLLGGAGDDLLDGGSGDDTLDGGSGVDEATFAGSAGPVTVSLFVAGRQSVGSLGTDVLVSVENLRGSDFGDAFTGSGEANRLDGSAGDDTLLGGAGDDTLLGGDGRDRLGLGGGSDLLNGGAGDDVILGSDGADTVIGGSGLDTADQGSAGDGQSRRLRHGARRDRGRRDGDRGVGPAQRHRRRVGRRGPEPDGEPRARNVLGDRGGDDRRLGRGNRLRFSGSELPERVGRRRRRRRHRRRPRQPADRRAGGRRPARRRRRRHAARRRRRRRAAGRRRR
jgi:hypothetical protein